MGVSNVESWVTQGCPWVSHRVTVVAHGPPLGRLWDTHGSPVGYPWHSHGSPSGGLWMTYALPNMSPMALPEVLVDRWVNHGSHMLYILSTDESFLCLPLECGVGPWVDRRSLTAFSLVHGTDLRRVTHESRMGCPWASHISRRKRPWVSRGFLAVVQGLPIGRPWVRLMSLSLPWVGHGSSMEIPRIYCTRS